MRQTHVLITIGQNDSMLADRENKTNSEAAVKSER